MKIKELAQNAQACGLNGNLKQTAKIIETANSDAAVLKNEKNEIIGVITQNAICQAVARFDRKPSMIKNSEITLEEVLICKAQENFSKVLRRLKKKRLKYAVFSSQKDETVAIISLPNILLRFTEDKKTVKKVFRAMEEISKPLPLVLSEIRLEDK